MRRDPKFGYAQLVIGILLVILGFFTLFNPQTLLRWVVRIYGLIAVITGIADIMFYVRATRFTGFGPMTSLITGLLSTMAGFMLMIYPGSGTWILILLMPVWIIAHSISRLCHIDEIRANGNFQYLISLIMNILGIVLGILMIFSPSLNYLASGIILGSCMLIMGIDLIASAAGELKKR